MTDIRRALTGSAEHPSLAFQRTYRATPEEVHAACVQPERLARWLGTIDGAPTSVGDAITIDLGGADDDVATCKVRACDDESIAIDWSWPSEQDSVVTVRTRDNGDGTTTLTLRHNLGEPAHAGDYGGGWEHLLTSLQRTLDEKQSHPLRTGDARSDIDAEGAAVGLDLARPALA